jgi:glycosyltransferase involved in cell wall biosynthesis
MCAFRVPETADYERPVGLELAAPCVPLSDSPLVSLVMTSFNSEEWLEKALRSALDQSWRKLEVILIDDASSDNSVEIALQLATTDTRLRVFRMSRNSGTYAARNAALVVFRGEVVTFMDSDDTSDPERVACQLALLRTPGLVATTCNFVRHTEEGKLVLNRGLPERQALVSLMIKRQVVLEVGGFHVARTSADDEYFERIRYVYGRQAHANVPKPLYKALYRDSSLSRTGPGALELSADESSPALSPERQAYVDAYRVWYVELARRGARPFMPL